MLADEDVAENWEEDDEESGNDSCSSDIDFIDAPGFEEDGDDDIYVRVVDFNSSSQSASRISESVAPLTPAMPPRVVQKENKELGQQQNREHVDEQTEHASSTPSEFLVAAHHRVVRIQAQRWRDENQELHAQIEGLIEERQQWEAEEGDMQLALEGAEKLHRDLQKSQCSEAVHRITVVLMASQLRERQATLSLAFRQLDRHRLRHSFNQLTAVADRMKQDVSSSLKLAADLSSSSSSAHLSNCDICERRKQKMAQLLISISDTTFDLQLRLRALKSSAAMSTLEDTKKVNSRGIGGGLE